MTDITFSTVPDPELLPGYYLETAADNPSLPEQKTLIVGQTLDNQPNLPVWVGSVKTAVNLFGQRSQLASAFQQYINNDVEADGAWMLPYADLVGGTQATGAIQITGTATAAGTLFFYIAGRYVTLAVNLGDTGQTVAANLVTRINSWVDLSDTRLTMGHGAKRKKHRFINGCKLPLTAVVDGTINTKVDLTAAHKGTIGNGIDIQLNYLGATGQETTPKGLTVAITAMSGGTGDPVITNLDTILVNTDYDFVIAPWNTSTQLDALDAFVEARWGATRDLYGGYFTARLAEGNNGSGAITFGQTRNGKHGVVVNYEPGCPTTEYDTAAAYAGAFIQSSRADPAVPTTNLPINGLMAPHRDQHFAEGTRESLLASGCALMGYNSDRTCHILRAVTTYQLDENGSPDASWRDMETTYTVMAINRSRKAAYLAAFPRAKLADDGTTFGPGTQFSQGLPNQPLATPKSIKAMLVAHYAGTLANARALVDPSSVGFFAQNIVVQRRSTDPSRIDILCPDTLIGGLRVTASMTLFQLQQASAAA